MSPEDAALVARAGDALRVHGDKQWSFSMPFTMAFQIASQLQLALRHPENDGGGAAAARAFIEAIGGGLRLISPDLAELMEHGNDPARDVATAGAKSGGSSAPAEWMHRVAGAIAFTDAKIAEEIDGGTLDARTALAVLSYVRFRLAFLGAGLDDALTIPKTEEAASRAVQERTKPQGSLLPFKIEQLWAFLAQDADKQEGVVAVQMGHVAMPLIAADATRVEQLRPLALEMALRGNTRIVLARFDHRVDDDVIEQPFRPGGQG